MANTTSVRGKRSTETTNPEKKNPAAGAASLGGKRGIDILHDPVLNKATAYTEAERQALGLVGLVPDTTESEDLQLRRGGVGQLGPGHKKPSGNLRQAIFYWLTRSCQR